MRHIQKLPSTTNTTKRGRTANQLHYLDWLEDSIEATGIPTQEPTNEDQTTLHIGLLRREVIDCTRTLHGALRGIWVWGEELLVARVQYAVPCGFHVIDRTFVTVVVARTVYSVVLSATPP